LRIKPKETEQDWGGLVRATLCPRYHWQQWGNDAEENKETSGGSEITTADVLTNKAKC